MPANVKAIDPENKMEQYIGSPYTSVPNPFNTEHENYAKYFEDEFMESIKKFGIEMDYDIRQICTLPGSTVMISSRRSRREKRSSTFWTASVLRMLRKGNVMHTFPVSIFCPNAQRILTKITSISDDWYSGRIRMRVRTQGDI